MSGTDICFMIGFHFFLVCKYHITLWFLKLICKTYSDREGGGDIAIKKERGGQRKRNRDFPSATSFPKSPPLLRVEPS